MSSCSEIVDAVLAFYQQVIRHPYLDDAALKIPPTSGWENMELAGVQNPGKSEAVIELLKRLPYLESTGQYERLLVQYETVPIDWTQRSYVAMEQVNPLPAHCVYLTEGVDCEGYSLILNVEEGTITAYSTSGYEISNFYQEYQSLPEHEKWRAHRTLPAAEFFGNWAAQYARLVNILVPNLIGQPTTGAFHSRVKNRLEGERLAQETGPLEDWHPDIQELTRWIKDKAMEQHHAARRRHTVAVYNCFIRHGWPDVFDKEACKSEVTELEKQAAAEEKAACDANNPDAALFDD